MALQLCQGYVQGLDECQCGVLYVRACVHQRPEKNKNKVESRAG